MRWLRSFWEKRESDLERELQAHLDLEAEEREENGVAPDEARYAARRAFGNVTLLQEETRATWGWSWLERLAQDLRLALRMMGKAPGFTLVAVLSLALGVGGTTAVFSVLDAAVLRPMDVREPDRLVIVRAMHRGERFVLFNPFFEEIRRRQTTLEELFAISDSSHWKTTFEGAGAPTYVRGSKVSGSYFPSLGLSPALGRLLTEADDEIPEAFGGGCAVVLSHTAWTRRFGQDPGVLGRGVRIGDAHCSIVGVAPPGFQSTQAGYEPELWGPIRALTGRSLLEHRRLAFFSGVMGRLRDGVTITEAEAELTTLYQQIMAAEPPAKEAMDVRPSLPEEFTIRLEPGGHGLDDVARQFGRPLTLVLGVAAVVLLIAALNVANLLLSRGAVRSSELATRAALGAGRNRLMWQLVTEGAAFAMFGGALGVALALAGAPWLASLVSLSYLPIQLDVSVDHRVLLVAFSATMIAAVVAGVVPALRATGGTLQRAIASAGRTAGDRSAQRLTRALVAVQLAMSLLLVSAAGLLLRTLVRLGSIDPGFRPEQVVILQVGHEGGGFFGNEDAKAGADRLARLYASLDERLNALPGVRSASLSWLGLFGGSDLWTRIAVAERQGDDAPNARVDYVTDRYFDAVGMQVLKGRGFERSDRADAPKVAVVNEAFVRQRFPGEEPLGRRLVFFEQAQLPDPFTIVGVVRDSKYNSLREDKTEPMVWTPLTQAPIRISNVTLRVEPGSEATVLQAVEQALTAADPEIMVRRQTTLSGQVARTTARERLLLGLASAFGGLALSLAAIGLYGTLAHAVARRTREIGVRLALGANSATVLRNVVGDALRLTLWGAAFGAPLALLAGYFLRGFLFGIQPHDFTALGGAWIVLTFVSVLAAYFPARRASRVNPIEALRYE